MRKFIRITLNALNNYNIDSIMWTTECILKYSRKGLRNLMLHLPHYAVFFEHTLTVASERNHDQNQKFAHDNTTMIIFRPQVWRRRTYICFLITTECVPLIMIRFTRSHTHCGWALREPKRRKRSLRLSFQLWRGQTLWRVYRDLTTTLFGSSMFARPQYHV